MRTTLGLRGPAPRWAGILANSLAVVFTVGCVSLAIALLAAPHALAEAGDGANASDTPEDNDREARDLADLHLAFEDDADLTEQERAQAIEALEARLKEIRGAELRDQPWVFVLGLIGQSFFFLRFFLQWVTSERRKQSVVPISFWYSSLAAATLVLVYGFLRADPVIVIGQSAGFFIYMRNLVLIGRRRRQLAEKLAARAGGRLSDDDAGTDSAPNEATAAETAASAPYSAVSGDTDVIAGSDQETDDGRDPASEPRPQS